MLTDKELMGLLDQVNRHLQPKWNRLEELERKMEEWSNGKGEGPKAGKGGSKRLQSAKEDSKSHVVVAKEGDEVKTIRFGQQGVSGAGSAPKSEKDKARRKSFKARHAKNIAKGKMSAAYWANKEKW